MVCLCCGLCIEMSAALVRKSLALVNSSFDTKRTKNKKNVFDFVPDDKKFAKKIHKRNIKFKKRDALPNKNKFSVNDIRQKSKSKEEIIQRNLKKLELIKQICKIELNEEIKSQLFERAICRRPVQLKSKKHRKNKEHTAFTEEDFKNFETEYLKS